MLSHACVRTLSTSSRLRGSRAKKVHRGLAALRILSRIKKSAVDDAKYEDSTYFEKTAAALPLDERYLDEMGKLYTKKVEINKDLQFKIDDKFVSEHDKTYRLPEIKPLDPKVEYAHVPALENAPDSVKRIFSAEYGERNDKYRYVDDKMVQKVQTNRLDRYSLPANIALLTSDIRQLTRDLDYAWTSNKRRPQWMKQTITEKIEERRKLLVKLKNTDSQGYEDVLKILELNHAEREYAGDLPDFGFDAPDKLRPKTGPYSYVDPLFIHALRHEWIKHNLKQRVEVIKEEKLKLFSLELYNKQEEFFKKKQEREPQILQQIKELELEIKQIKEELEPVLEVEGVYSMSTVDTRREAKWHNYFFRDIEKYRRAAFK